MPAPAVYARESDGKDTAKKVIFNVLIGFFLKISKKILYLCSVHPADRVAWATIVISEQKK